MSFISHTRRTEEHLWQAWAPRTGTRGPPKCLCMCICARVQGLQHCCTSGPMKREPLMRDE